MLGEEEVASGGSAAKSGGWIQNNQGSSSDDRQQQEQQQQQQPATRALGRKERLARSCTVRGNSARFFSRGAAEPTRKPPSAVKEEPQCKIITPLARSPPPSQLQRWSLRSMWELASILNFLHIFRPLLNINAEFSAEELETALITPNNTLDDIHMPLLKAIPPITRMAFGRATWVTVLCRKLRDWWHWVAEGDIPIVACHGAEVELYKSLEPATRVVILKALCDIRVEQEDIRSYIDDSVKHGVPLSTFRRERIGGDAYGTNYWFEDDEISGHRLYREIRKIETKRFKKGLPTQPIISCQWETVASNLDEFQEVSEKLSLSKNRTEASLGKRLKSDILPEIEKIHKRKERALKKQQRQALLLDNYMTTDGLAAGRSLRDRKPVTYTFDDFDRSINEAIKITKKRQPSPEAMARRDALKPEAAVNGKVNGPTRSTRNVSVDTSSPKSTDYEETDGEQKSGPLDRSNRRRQRPQKYSEFIDAVSDNEADFDSDEDIMGEAVYDDEYLRNRKHKKALSSSEGDEEYRWDDEIGEDDDEEEEEDEDSLSLSEEVERSHRPRKPPRSRRETKLRSVDEIESGLRRSKRATRNRINYRQYEYSDSEADSSKPEKPDAPEGRSDASDSVDYSMESDDSRQDEVLETKDNGRPDYMETTIEESNEPLVKTNSPPQDGGDQTKRRFLDLNELAPGTGFDDGPSSSMVKDESGD
ncbi:DDT domain-containing protein DDR4-like [Nymphaea colorata]|nr:DDT domain-containing protein DDR4-like [Nymphaea colorata]